MARQELERELHALHARSYGWALACSARNHDEASDVLQDAYFKVLSGRARWDERSAFKTWLFGVIRFTAMERRRTRFFRGRQVPTGDIVELAAPSSRRVDRETTEAIERALRKVSERQREVLHLVFYEDLTIAEAAEVLGVALGTARIHYERGKAAMLTLLEQEGVTLR